ncbi:MAG TPA: hypothetical protein VNK43_05990 [Gemmatimonadales bacterium]|nr:hypothetical protein [Gemmatimonadales bacterium]
MPGRPPGHQAPPGTCRKVEREAPAGSWILYRPASDKKVVHVRVVDERRAGAVVKVRVYAVANGAFVREERP